MKNLLIMTLLTGFSMSAQTVPNADRQKIDSLRTINNNLYDQQPQQTKENNDAVLFVGFAVFCIFAYAMSRVD